MTGINSINSINSMDINAMARDLELQWKEGLHRYAEALSACVSVRLTGPREASGIYAHILDCLFSVPLLPPSGAVIDVGSGGGLPGVVWAITRPDLSVTLLDSARKKCQAAQGLVSSLGLSNVSVVCRRCEEYALISREVFSLAAARAVTHAGVLCEYLSPLTKVGGRLLAFKGPKGGAELRETESKRGDDSWTAIGLTKPEIIPYGDSDQSRVFVIWDKKAPCPARFPRRAGIAEAKKWWLT
ncbi:ribosomal RNA small subunit methyltransferase G [Synergistales bacterium]|nr:ribosomal RNA small subunit methyltransferase G [Synergistales bacterium]